MSAILAAPGRHEGSGAGLGGLYERKPADYFAQDARMDFIDPLPRDPHASILELGCASGATGAAALKSDKCGRYVGIEMDPTAAAAAREVISTVVVGDVCAMDLGAFAGQFDVLIASEVLEHLTDPWAALRALRACLKPGGRVLASSPNVAHRAIVWQLLRGRFDYAPSGALDQTHLRWFTPATYRELFEDTGFCVDEVRAVEPPSAKTRLRRLLTGGRLSHLFTHRIMVRAHAPAG